MVTEVGGKEGILVTGGCNNNCEDHLDDTIFFDFATEKWEVSNFNQVGSWMEGKIFSQNKNIVSDFGSQVKQTTDENGNG